MGYPTLVVEPGEKYLFGEAVVVHSHHMARPAKAMAGDDGFNAGRLAAVKYLRIWRHVVPFNVGKKAKMPEVKTVEQIDVFPVARPRFAAVEKR